MKMSSKNYGLENKGKTVTQSSRSFTKEEALLIDPPKLKEQEQEECPEGYHRNEEGVCVLDNPPESKDVPECPPGEHYDEERKICVKDTVVGDEAREQEEHECELGYHWDSEKEQCVKDVVAEQEEHECPEGEHWDADQGKCVANAASEQEEHECPEGEHWDDAEGRCVKDAEEAPPEAAEILKKKIVPLAGSKIKETKLSLGEPFAGYTDFADCVAKNQDKENPEAYCGQIKKDAEGTAGEIAGAYRKIDELVEALNTLRVVKDDVSWKRRLKEIERKFMRVNAWPPLVVLNDKWKLSEAEIKKLKEALNKLPGDNLSWKKGIAECKTQLADIKGLKDAHDNNAEHITENTRQIEKLTEMVAAQKKDFETVLAVADKNIVETRKSLEAQISELQLKNAELEAKKIRETEEITAKMADLTVKTDNLEDKLKPQFKGKTKEALKKDTPVVEDPLKPQRRVT